MMTSAAHLLNSQLEGEGRRTMLVNLFQQIEQERMRDIPVLNDKLSVAAFGFDAANDAGFMPGLLVTPWFMSLLLMPVDQVILTDAHVGDKQNHALPGGQFEFIVCFEERLGYYLSCSLFSPMFQFADQQAATDTAQAVLTMVLDPDAMGPDSTEASVSQEALEMQAIWEGAPPEPVITDADPVPPSTPSAEPQPSRRDLLLGLRTSRSAVLAEDDEAVS